MSAKALLGQLLVQSPCNASWDAMSGNDRIRFCEHCQLSVHNLSSLTRKETMLLVARSKGRLCVRYHKLPDDSPATKLNKPLVQISHRVSRIAAGAFTAALTITSANAVQSAPTAPSSLLTSRKPRSVVNTGIVIGTVKDINGALITSATVSLFSDQTGLAFYTSSDLSGEFRFEGLAPGLYRLRLVAPGFSAIETSLYVQDDHETRVEQTLEVESIETSVEIQAEGTEVAVMGAVSFVAPQDPFIRAAQEDDLAEVTKLIAGQDVNQRDKRSHTTALEHAVRNANREMVQLLLLAGAKADAANESGETPLMMLDADATSDLVWDLIYAGAKVNGNDKGGNTPLMAIADSSNIEALKVLLEAGAKVNAKNEGGQTALMMAASEGMVNSVRLLIVSGAEVNAEDKKGRNALSYATSGNHAAVIRLLHSQGASESCVITKEESDD